MPSCLRFSWSASLLDPTGSQGFGSRLTANDEGDMASASPQVRFGIGFGSILGFRLFRRRNVVFVLDLAYDLFKNVLQSEYPKNVSVVVSHNSHRTAGLSE